MKTYHLKGKTGIADIEFSMNDLLPIPQAKTYDFTQLANLIDYRDYHAERHFNSEDWKKLYAIPANRNCDFFEIRDTGVIVIPGSCLFPTILRENQITQKL